MPVRDPQTVLQKLGQTTLKVDTYFLQHTGFVSNQTVLKLGEYNLHCVPATIGVVESRLLAVLSPAEINHFSKFKGGTQTLLLAFHDPEKRDIARFPLRVSLVDFEVVSEHKNACFLVVKAKSLPSEFILFLGDFLEELEGRKAAWEAASGEVIPLVPGDPPALDGAAVVAVGDRQFEVQIVGFQAKLVQLEWPQGPVAETPAQLRLKLRSQPLVLEGRTDAGGGFVPEFQPDWLAFVEDLRFQRSLKARGALRRTP